eukprot:TRINITY_DN5509_c0_g1_i1.p1 TRINITY_DN5509_c0_g1~~TRINITY_DN5509_c0_g1_i1.p1  ORF type:complete len:237 (-),score=59.25 TRINITY_DN5509_c0_g1_i1:188-832(-)
MPLRVELLAKKYLRHPIFLAIGERHGVANENIEQRVEWMSQGNKQRRLLEIVREEEPPFIVFCNAKKQCDSIARQISDSGVPAIVLHGGKVQEQRDENLQAFKEGKYKVLVATDVVGRGIDIQGVKQVINYDLPSTIDKYTHRIGRTGRAGLKGIATSFLTADDTEIMYDLKEMLKQCGQNIPFELSKADAAQKKPGSFDYNKKRKDTTLFAKH